MKMPMILQAVESIPRYSTTIGPLYVISSIHGTSLIGSLTYDHAQHYIEVAISEACHSCEYRYCHTDSCKAIVPEDFAALLAMRSKCVFGKRLTKD